MKELTKLLAIAFIRAISNLCWIFIICICILALIKIVNRELFDIIIITFRDAKYVPIQ